MEAVAFVLNSNQLEQVGTQGYLVTQKLCESAASAAAAADRESSPVAAAADRESSETIQTYLALQCAHRLRGEMQAALSEDDAPPHHALLLSPGYQCEIHGELMEGLVEQPGSYRTAECKPSGYNFFYASPETIESRVLAWTDAVNDIVVSLPAVTLPDAFKLAALVLFNAVDVHPFQDGNGRLCRIMASGMLSQHHFFPVCLQPFTEPRGEDSHSHLAWRTIYIDAIEACRWDAAHRPSDLAALLIESSWAAWTRIQGLVAESVDDNGAPLLGTIVLGKRIGQDARERVSSRWASLCHNRRPGGKPEGAAEREEDI